MNGKRKYFNRTSAIVFHAVHRSIKSDNLKVKKICCFVNLNMKMSISTDVWKYFLLILSILISLNAMAIISIGVLVLGGAGSISGAYMITLLGFLILSLGAVGCFCSMRESYMLTVVFLGLAAFLIVCEVIFMIAFAAMKTDYIEMTGNRVSDIWEQELIKPGAMFGIQMQYECCGKDSPQDYLKDADDELPSSCCYWNDCTHKQNVHTGGCLPNAVNFVQQQSDLLILSVLGVVALEVIGMLVAFYYGRSRQLILAKNEQATATSD